MSDPSTFTDASKGRIVHGRPDVDLSGEVEHHIGPERPDRPLNAGSVADVQLGEFAARRERRAEVVHLAAREVVDHENLRAGRHEGVDKVRSDARASG